VPTELSPTVALLAQSDGRHCTALQQNLADCQEFTDDHEVGTVMIPKERRQMSLYGAVVGSGIPRGGGGGGASPPHKPSRPHKTTEKTNQG